MYGYTGLLYTDNNLTSIMYQTSALTRFSAPPYYSILNLTACLSFTTALYISMLLISAILFQPEDLFSALL